MIKRIPILHIWPKVTSRDVQGTGCHRHAFRCGENDIQMCGERHNTYSDVQGTTRHTFRCTGNDTTHIQMCRERHDTHSDVQGTTRHAFSCAGNDTTRIQMCRERHDTHSDVQRTTRHAFRCAGNDMWTTRIQNCSCLVHKYVVTITKEFSYS